MQNKYLKFLLIALIVAFIVPQITLASWYNPFSWNWNIWSWFKSPTTQNSPIVGGDKDNHGCIGSAGYTWCEVKNKCLRSWEEDCNISSDIYPLYSNLKWGNSSPQIIQSIAGFQITATDNINNNSDAKKFFNYYDSKLKSSGWSLDNNFSADGILGSQIGYQKDSNYIILGYTIKPGTVTSGTNEPLQWTCPCAIAYSIFTGQ
jgi:hypothetical protein